MKKLFNSGSYSLTPTRVKAPYKVVLALYLLVLLWLVLFKFSLSLSVVEYPIRTLNLIPFADASKDNLSEVFFNLIAFIPLGLLLSVSLKQADLWRKLALVCGVSLAVETIQFIFVIGITDITDVITNTVGGFLGLLLYDLSNRHITKERLDRFIAVASAVLLISLLGILLTGTVRFHLVDPPGGDMPLEGGNGTTETNSRRVILAKDVQFVWPAIGQAAIGSVEDGFFARSSASEALRPTASMAKVITALAIMEKQPFELGQTGRSYALTSKDVANYRKYAAKNGSVLPVRVGMELTQYQAIQMMLIASDNNMADMLAERTFGGMEAYISYAQDMLRRKGLNRTIVADASGFSPATVSTPSELVSIGIAALKNPVIAEIVAQSQAEIPGVGIIKNTNELLDTDGAVGIKTGTTNEAGSCLLFAARYRADDGQRVTIVGVIMGDKNPINLFGDSRNLLASAGRGLNLTETQPTSNVTIPPPMRDDRAPQ